MSYEKIPDSVYAAVLRHYDIVDTVGKYVQLSKSGKYLKGLCPFHSERTPSFTVTPEKQIFYCYGCGKTGNSIKFIEEIEEYSHVEAIRHMVAEAGLVLDWQSQNYKPRTEDTERDKLIEAHELTAKLYHYLLMNTTHGQQALSYLRGRGVTDKQIEQFNIGYAPPEWDTLTRFLEKREFDLSKMEKGGLLTARNEGNGYYDKFRDRIMFPIWNRDGKVIAFAGRLLGEGVPKYLNTPETKLFTKGRVLYNFHGARVAMRKSRNVVLFEGYMDVIKSWSAGVHNGIASMGTALTDEQIALLQRNADDAIICYDGDNAGMAAAMKTIPLLEKAGMRVQVAMLPQGMDPDEYIEKFGAQSFMREIIEHPASATKFRLIYAKKNHILLEEEGRKNYLLEAAGIIAALDSPIEREIYLKDLSREFDISLDVLKQDVFAHREKSYKMKPQRDNNDNWWNNGRNENRRMPVTPAPTSAPKVLPAYQVAERRLLALMLQDADVAQTVHDKLGEAFNVEDHAALAAYLYAYYAQGHDPDVSRFIASLQDDRLERTAASILMTEDQIPYDEQLLEDYVREIRKVPLFREIERKREDMVRAERSGDILLAARIGIEINTLERQLKNR
ncbi:DNA primase [Paenibacillus phyllosphaerae]|uniref:DNA primase n=1 Tax=Paenibacillus phyllosphaerae TaxID=274593 RepID=A0A7W5FLA7_9BACL|nr:DNA primase [Paenibacillus phyllosphaerae]MBB3109015.1 DNA primase [Paenibacillus phyllosphaerae]